MAGTIIADVIQSDQSYPSSINIASPVIISNTFSSTSGIQLSNNLTFTGTGNRITGDMSNATAANRVTFQTSTTNGATVVNAIPNGTGTYGGFTGFNASDTANSSIASIAAAASEVQVVSTRTGTGTFLPMTFYTAAGERMRIDTSGNVGIGASSLISGAKFQVKTATDKNFFIGTNSVGYLNDAGSSWVQTDVKGSTITFGIGQFAVEAARIDSSGYVRVNNTSGLDGQLSSLAGAWYAGAFANTDATYPTAYSWNKATSGNNIFYQFYSDAPSASRGTIDYNRGAGLVRYNTTSDATLKNIIGDSDGAKSVEILNSTRIREFAWKDDETQKPQIGVIAQELYETYKGAVSVGGDVEKTDNEGNVTTEYRPWGVDKTAFTFHLVAGWQAHEKLIKQQAETIAALEARIATLEAQA